MAAVAFEGGATDSERTEKRRGSSSTSTKPLAARSTYPRLSCSRVLTHNLIALCSFRIRASATPRESTGRVQQRGSQLGECNSAGQCNSAGVNRASTTSRESTGRVQQRGPVQQRGSQLGEYNNAGQRGLLPFVEGWLPVFVS